MKVNKAFVFLFLLMALLITFIPVVLGEKNERITNGQRSCTSIIVGKNATVDGSVLLGHNEDWGFYVKPLMLMPREKHIPGEVFKLKDGQEIPQVEETYAFIWPAANCNGINEHQVAIVDNTGSCRKELFQNEWGLDLEEFVTLAMQRAKTAREAVVITGKLVEKYNYRSYNGKWGDLFSITDPQEGWWMEVTIGGLWVAQRVPDDSIVVLANRFRIGKVNLKDNKNFLAAKNLKSYAVEQGWYNPADGPFNFSLVYSEPEEEEDTYNSHREWRANSLLAGVKLPEDNNPLLLIPMKKVSPQNLMKIFRDHYEGTKYDLTDGYKKGSPHHTAERVICTMYTDTSTIAQLRSWLPSEIGGVLWLSIGTPCSSVYVPYYLGCEEFPYPYTYITEKYDRRNAYWAFNSMQNLVDLNYGKKMKLQDKELRTIDYVSNIWRNFEVQEFARQKVIEKKALELYTKDKSSARSLLTSHSYNLALKAYNKALQISNELRNHFHQQHKH